MFKNRNGYWMSPKFYAMYAPDDGAGNGGAEAGTGGESGNGSGGEGDPAGADGGAKGGSESETATLLAQIEQMKADMAKQKKALDDATKEAGDYRKQLKAKMTQAEIDEANKKEAEEKQAARLAELEKEVARTRSSKSVMAKLGVDEENAGKIAECLIGCEDIDNALLLIQKTWEAKEKALRLEFGKIPGPGAGGSGGEDAEERAAIERAKRLGRSRAEGDKSVSEGLKGYMR